MLSKNELQEALQRMIQDLIDRRDSAGRWQQLRPEARRVLLRVHLNAAEEGLVGADREAAISALELAELTDAPDGALAAAEYAMHTLEWAADDETLVDRARTIAAERLLSVRPASAKQLLDEQLRYQEAALGRDHPDTLDTRSYLAVALLGMGSVNEAVARFEALLADQERVLGADHHDTLMTRNNLASALLEMGRVEEAVARFEKLLTDQERVLGADHPHTLVTRINLASAVTAAFG